MVFTTVKRSVAESLPDRAVSAPTQNCSSPLLKVERSVSDRFLKRFNSSLNTFIGAEVATEPCTGK